MKVFYDFQIFSLQRRGGISRYFSSLWGELQKHKDFSGELFLGINQTEMDAEIKSVIRINGFRLKDPQWPKTWRLTRRLNTWLCQRQLCKSAAQIYHPTQNWLPQDLRGKTLVITIHDLIYELMPERFAPADPAFLWRPEAIKRAKIILTVSENTKRDLCRIYHVAPSKVFVSPLGCSLTAALKVPKGKTGEKPFLLYVGDRAGYKNFKLLMDVWRRSALLRGGFQLVCFGGAEPTLEESSLPGDVRFCRGDDLMLSELYRTATALVYPSLYEGFGFPVLEAFEFGCPVLTTGCGSLREVAGQAAIYFNPHEADSLLSAITTIINDPARRSAVIAEGHRQKKQFSWQRCAAVTRQAYLAALES
ncbi:MAG: glycosyltransferase family 1 protein [Verrucomicrobiota bacterium]